MKVFLHACCAPCLVYPYNYLKSQDIEVTVFFYNPNIHPFLEFRKRLESITTYSENKMFPLIINKKYGLTEFLRKIVFHEIERCRLCYLMRLKKTALMAKEIGFDAFTTTLLYSKYQQHGLIVSLCNTISMESDIPFFYHDFREGWQSGVSESIELKMYRQSYCGCIYSEQERYDKSLKKQFI
jgi:epoxyqueuosine reductase